MYLIDIIVTIVRVGLKLLFYKQLLTEQILPKMPFISLFNECQGQYIDVLPPTPFTSQSN